jgi:hypothetical protein
MTSWQSIPLTAARWKSNVYYEFYAPISYLNNSDGKINKTFLKVEILTLFRHSSLLVYPARGYKLSSIILFIIRQLHHDLGT